VLPFRWVTGDEHCGNTPLLLEQLAAAGLAYFLAIPHNVPMRRARGQAAYRCGRTSVGRGGEGTVTSGRSPR